MAGCWLTLWLLGGLLFGVLCRPEPRGPENCALLTAPWSEVTALTGNCTTIHRLRVLPASKSAPNRLVFPEQPLFRFVQRVYHCCQSGHHCPGVKGIQGQPAGDSSTDFVIDEDVLSAPVLRAELHLHISNPQQLNITPLLPWLHKRHLPTRYMARWKDGVQDLRLDLLFLFQTLQTVRGLNLGPVPGVWAIRRVGWSRAMLSQSAKVKTTKEESEHHLQTPRELSLILHCGQACDGQGLQLTHTPFITLTYR